MGCDAPPGVDFTLMEEIIERLERIESALTGQGAYLDTKQASAPTAARLGRWSPGVARHRSALR